MRLSVFKIKPSPLTGSTREFIIPPTILSDYTNYLYTEVPNVVYDFQLLSSWYDKFDETKEPVYLRVEFFPINWKSKVGNSDMNYNFYCNYDVPIKKGDMVIKLDDNSVHMLNWEIQKYINAQTTQAISCNYYVTITRDVKAKADMRGYIVEEAHEETIVDNLPAMFSEYAGRPDFMVSQNSPGVVSDMLSVCDVQVNPSTLNVRVGDKLVWGIFTYRVVSIDQTQIAIGRDHGIIRLYLRRVAGENL